MMMQQKQVKRLKGFRLSQLLSLIVITEKLVGYRFRFDWLLRHSKIVSDSGCLLASYASL